MTEPIRVGDGCIVHTLRGFWLTAAIAVLLSLGLLNLRGLRHPADGYEADELPSDLVPQLHYLDGALTAGGAEQMNQLFPEGTVFTWSLYGLAWVNAAKRDPSLVPEAREQATRALTALDGGEATKRFSRDIDPPLGVFYVGWTTWLRGGLISLGQAEPAQRLRFREDCAAIAAALDAAETPYLQSYAGASWPADSTVAVAALRLHDEIEAPLFRDTVSTWVSDTRARLDPETGLIPHATDSRTGQTLEGARGISQVLMGRFVAEIDPQLAREQYAAFSRRYVTTRYAIPGVLEYPPGQEGSGDIDSGPVIAGFSGPGIVVGIAAARMNGDRVTEGALLRATEIGGLPFQWAGKKRYAGGIVVVGDAFLAWAKSVTGWVRQPPPQAEPLLSPWWLLPWQLGSLLLIIIAWVPVLAWWRRAHRVIRQRFLESR